MRVLQYIVLSSACLSLLYIAFRLIYRNGANFRQMRIFLMGSVLLSLLIPLSHYEIKIWQKPQSPVQVIQLLNPEETPIGAPENASPTIDGAAIAIYIYVLVTAFFLVRILLQLVILFFNYIKSEKLTRNDCVLLFNHSFRNTFSFFGWIFIGPSEIKKEDLEHIIIHEKIHATQYHTLDLIVIELLTAVMWFNPLIRMMKNSIQLVHEYLADEGALNTGIDKHRYQALLINQITEDKLISLSSSFNHSLIKKRMKMMLSKKFNRGSKLKIMTMFPLAAFLFVVTAMINVFVPRDLSASQSKSLDLQGMINNSVTLETPADTIKTKTIKIVHKKEGADSVITETYDVKVTGDTARGTRIVYHNNDKMAGDTSEVFYVISKEHPEIIVSEEADLPEDVLVHTKVMHSEKVIIAKTTTSHNSGDQELSNTLIIIDGVKHTEKDALKSLNPDLIESMNVIRDKKMMKQYTDKEYEGVILITTKAPKK